MASCAGRTGFGADERHSPQSPIAPMRARRANCLQYWCMETPFFRLDEIAAFPMTTGVTGRPVFGQDAMINLAELEPGAVVSDHSHPHEQIGLVLRGMMELTVDGVTRELLPMDGAVIPGGVVHSARGGPEGAVVVDVFQPVREDYREHWMGQSLRP